jgi:cytochrome c
MKIVASLAGAAAAALFAAGAHAADAKAGEALARSSGCLACHTVDKKLVGPSYKEIADRYRAEKGAAESLAGKVKAGSKGAWGDIPMPPNGHLKDADLKTIVDWILSTR